MRVLGVDPGATGALAMIDTELAALIVRDMPAVEIGGRQQISDVWLADTLREWEPDYAWIERVHAMPKQGVTSSFNFGLSYGLARGALAALIVPVSFVTPNEWKRYFRLSADKNEARTTAARLFPEASALFTRSKDNGRAEAALIALFGAQSMKELPSAAGF